VPDVICDTSPIQYLHQCGVLLLLHDLYSSIIIPEAVLAELAEGRARGADLPDVARLPWVETRRVPGRRLLELASDLGPGEREALALAAESDDSLLVMDDKLGRKHARLMGIPLTGTLGVLIRAKHAGLVHAVTPLVDRLDELQFRLSRRMRVVALQAAGEA
jgi:hypothetical protein